MAAGERLLVPDQQFRDYTTSSQNKVETLFDMYEPLPTVIHTLHELAGEMDDWIKRASTPLQPTVILHDLFPPLPNTPRTLHELAAEETVWMQQNGLGSSEKTQNPADVRRYQNEENDASETHRRKVFEAFGVDDPIEDLNPLKDLSNF